MEDQPLWFIIKIPLGIIGMECTKEFFKLKFLKYNSLYDVNMSYTDGYIAKHYTRKDILKLFKNFVIKKIKVCDSGPSDLGFGWHRFSLLFPKLTDKFNNFLNNKFGWFLVINVKK